MKMLWCFLAALFAFASPVYARPTSPPLIVLCPAGSGWNDGCMQAPQVGLTASAGTYQLTNCWGNGGAANQLNGTTTDYTQLNGSPVSSAQPWNSPGCEYPIGVDVPSSQRLDPAKISIPGCTYGGAGNTGPGGNAFLRCTGALVPTEFDNLELGPVGGHGCTGIIFGGTLAGAPFITIAHTNFINDGNCAVDLGGDWFNAQTSPATSFIFLDDTLDGNGLVYGDNYGTCVFPTLCNVTQAFKGQGAIFKDTVVKNFAGRPMNFGISSTQSFIISNSLVQGFDLRNPNAHGELIDGGWFGAPGGGEISLKFSNVFLTTGAEQSFEAVWPMQPSGASVGTLTTATMDHNVIIAPFVSGVSKSGTITSASIPAGGSSIVVAGVSTGTSIGSGQQFTCGALTGELSLPLSGQPSAGPGGGFNSTTNPANFPQTWGFDLNGSSTINAGTISNGSGAAGTQMNITQVGPLQLQVGSAISGPGVAAGTNITAIPAGGGVGIYTVDTSQLTTDGLTIIGASWNASTHQVAWTLSGTPTTPLVAGNSFTVTGVVNSPTSPNLFNANFTVVSTSGATIISSGPSTTPGTYASGGTIETLTASIQNIYAGGWAAATTQTCTNVATRSWGNGVIAAQDLIFSGAVYGQVTNTNNIIDMQAFQTALRVWGQGGGATGGCNSPTIWGGNIDPSGTETTLQMNSWTNTVVSGC